MPRGSKPGERRGGRTKGVPNKLTADLRAKVKSFCDLAVPQLAAMLEDTWHGIEIEKQMPDGSIVVGRLNANPGQAAMLTLKAMEFCIPKAGVDPEAPRLLAAPGDVAVREFRGSPEAIAALVAAARKAHPTQLEAANGKPRKAGDPRDPE